MRKKAVARDKKRAQQQPKSNGAIADMGDGIGNGSEASTNTWWTTLGKAFGLFGALGNSHARSSVAAAGESVADGSVDSVDDVGALIWAAVDSIPLATAGIASKGGVNSVYRSVDAAGGASYIGITKNLLQRAAAHLRQKGIVIDEIPGLSGLSRADSRAVEQVLIQHHGLGKNGGSLLNKINSIAETNPAYAGALTRGTELLQGAGYPGF